jgi:hypothetical protein
MLCVCWVCKHVQHSWVLHANTYVRTNQGLQMSDAQTSVHKRIAVIGSWFFYFILVFSLSDFTFRFFISYLINWQRFYKDSERQTTQKSLDASEVKSLNQNGTSSCAHLRPKLITHLKPLIEVNSHVNVNSHIDLLSASIYYKSQLAMWICYWHTQTAMTDG